MEKNFFNLRVFIVLITLLCFFLTRFNSADISSSLRITAGGCGSSLETCPTTAVEGGINTSMSGGTCSAVYGANSEFPEKKALIGPGNMTLCSLTGTPSNPVTNSLFIISKNDSTQAPYCTNQPTELNQPIGKPGQPGPGECPSDYQPSGSLRVGQGLTDGVPRGWDYCGNSIVNGNLTLCTKEGASLLIWSNDCGQTPEDNYTEACFGINQGGFHVGPTTGACSGDTYYGISASGKKIKSGWMYLCLSRTSRALPPFDLPTPALQPYFISPTPDDNKVYNIDNQNWFFIDANAGRAYNFPDYFEFVDELKGKPLCDPEFEPYSRLTAASAVIQGLPTGGNKTVYANQSFNCTNYISRADASIFLVRALNLTIDTSGPPHYGDVPSTHPAYAAVETLYNKGIRVNEDCGSGKFCENKAIKRREFAVWVAEALDLPDSPMNTTPTYCDVPTDDLNYSAIENVTARIVAAGEFGGSCGTSTRYFRPDNNLTREHAGKFLVNSARNCFAEVNGTNLSMDLGVGTYCSLNFTGITLQGKGLIEYDYAVWAGDVIGYLNNSVLRKVFFYKPSCGVSASPNQIEKSGPSAITVNYFLGAQPTTAQINCGVGQAIPAACSGGMSGSCSATCVYAEPAEYPVTYSVSTSLADVDGSIIQCKPASVTIVRQLPKVSFLDARCPMELVTSDSAAVSVEFVQNGAKTCNSGVLSRREDNRFKRR